MKKITKKQYTAELAKLTADKANLEAEVAIIIDNEIEALYPFLNAKHDAVDAMERQMRDLKHRWDTRNYTSSDWYARELIINNID